MDPGDGVLWAALAAAALAAVSGALGARHPGARRLTPYILLTSFTAGGVALLLLLTSFFTGDLGYSYVFENTDDRYPGYLKLAGLWAGRQGSLMVMAWSLAGISLLSEMAWHRRDAKAAGASEAGRSGAEKARTDDDGGRDRTIVNRYRAVSRTFTASLVAVFYAGVVTDSPFTPTDEILLSLAPHGDGLPAALETGFMAVHPPPVFIAYALCAVLAGAGLGRLATGYKGGDSGGTVIRLAWWTMTLGIGTGSMWAYLSLGYGGYWGWDPVETANLLPWLVLTALLHTRGGGFLTAEVAADRAGRGDKVAWSPFASFLAVHAFTTSLITTFVVRSGVWESVHDYAGPAGDDPLRRLAAALEDSPAAAAVFAVMMTIVVVSTVLFAVALRRSAREAARNDKVGEEEVGVNVEGVKEVGAKKEGAKKEGAKKEGVKAEGDKAEGEEEEKGGDIDLAKEGRYDLTPWTPRGRLELTMGLLVAGLLVTTVLFLRGPDEQSPPGYYSRAVIIVVPLMFLLGNCSLPLWWGIRQRCTAIAALVTVGVISAVAFPDGGVWSFAAGTAAGSAALIVAGVVLNTIGRCTRRSGDGRGDKRGGRRKWTFSCPWRDRWTWRGIMHLGIVVVLLGVSVNQGFDVSEEEGRIQGFSGIDVEGSTLHAEAVSMRVEGGGAPADMEEGLSLLLERISVRLVVNRDGPDRTNIDAHLRWHEGDGEYRSAPTVVTRGLTDYYVTIINVTFDHGRTVGAGDGQFYVGRNTTYFMVNATRAGMVVFFEEKPGVPLLWAGLFMTVGGSGALLLMPAAASTCSVMPARAVENKGRKKEE